jgi:hypothetical protein
MAGLLVLLLLSAPDEVPKAAHPNLLRSAVVSRVRGAPDVARMTDGQAPIDGDAWDTPHTALLAAGGVVEWDLGSARHLGQARIQADNNDTYLLSTSEDGARFTPLWAARPVGVPGMQTRTSEPLEATARYVRLTAEGGDTKYSVGELELFDAPQGLAEAVVKRIVPPPPAAPPPVNTAYLLVLGVAGLGAWFLRQAMLENRRRAAARSTPAEPPPR